MKIVGLSGFARSGKDEAARILVEEFGYTQVAFADKLRESLYGLNPIIAAKMSVCSESIKEGWEPFETVIYLQDFIDSVGWGGYKETKAGPEIRRLLQRLGTEAGRDVLGDTVWIDAALSGFDENSRIVVSDMRFKNEKRAIESRGGKTLRINRTGVEAANDHPSETELTNETFDFGIENDGSLEEYRAKVERFANELNL